MPVVQATALASIEEGTRLGRMAVRAVRLMHWAVEATKLPTYSQALAMSASATQTNATAATADSATLAMSSLRRS